MGGLCVTDFLVVSDSLCSSYKWSSQPTTHPATYLAPHDASSSISTIHTQVLSWEPRVPVREGLAKTVEYFRRELEETGE